ncbi:MAG: hypothetical protein KJO43_12355, partial [Phycisphaerae bacterium]|nr:hypothetical protein [Phycisphaerae bacterium]
LLELVVVLSVTVVLTGLLLPALSQVRENVNRVMCSSNLRQIGLGFTMYARDNSDRLPFSKMLTAGEPMELMAARLEDGSWDGIGLLFRDGYCDAPECFYCPSHTGQHQLDVNRWDRNLAIQGNRIYANYHYSGHKEWDGEQVVRQLHRGDRLVLAADGFRDRSDFNHDVGLNALRGDGSVRWFEDSAKEPFYGYVPDEALGIDPARTEHLWGLLERRVLHQH